MTRILVLVVGFMLLAAPAFAADVDGKWTGSIETPMGTVPVGFTFKADGATLTGTSLAPDGGEIAIKDGKVDGNKISFVEKGNYQGMPVQFSYTGELAGDEIHFKRELMGFPAEEFVAKRSK